MKNIVKMAERRPEDNTPRRLIRFFGHSDGNPGADEYVDLIGAVNAMRKKEGRKPVGKSDPRKKYRWVDYQVHFAPQDCPVEVTVPIHSDREEILALLDMVRDEILVQEIWPPILHEDTPDNVETFPPTTGKFFVKSYKVEHPPKKGDRT